jgi:archaellum component FlaF (FlaF/FlaG flagellin family)
MYYNRKKAIIKNVVLLILIFVIAILTTHHIYYKFKKERNVNYNSPSLDVVFHEKSGDKVTITKVTPVTDAVGLSSKAYTFTITNNLTIPVKYQVQLVKDKETIKADDCGEYLIPESVIKVAVKEDKSSTKISNLSDLEHDTLDTDTIKALGTTNYTIRVWTINNTMPNGSKLHYHGILQVKEVATNIVVG